MVHIPSSTTIYADAAGTKETRTIMRAELVAIHTALTTFDTHEWISIYMDSLSSLQAIRHRSTNPSTIGVNHCYHHRLLLGSITDLLETRRSAGLRTTLHKIRAHTNIRGNDLADAAAKLAVTRFDTLLPPQTLRVEIGGIVPRPTHWVMYMAEPQPTLLALSTNTNCATLRRPWWTIPEAERLQMYAFTRRSPQTQVKIQRCATT